MLTLTADVPLKQTLKKKQKKIFLNNLQKPCKECYDEVYDVFYVDEMFFIQKK